MDEQRRIKRDFKENVLPQWLSER